MKLIGNPRMAHSSNGFRGPHAEAHQGEGPHQTTGPGRPHSPVNQGWLMTMVDDVG